jgi:phage-related protein
MMWNTGSYCLPGPVGCSVMAGDALPSCAVDPDRPQLFPMVALEVKSAGWGPHARQRIAHCSQRGTRYTHFGITVTPSVPALDLPPLKPLRWVGTLDEIKQLPKPVQREIGFALHQAQLGSEHPSDKPLSGFGGASVLEIVEDHDKETYRAVYTVQLDPVVYVLHAFHKKSKKGIETPKPTLKVIERRLDAAKAFHKKPPPDLQREIAAYREATETYQQRAGGTKRQPTRERRPR